MVESVCRRRTIAFRTEQITDPTARRIYDEALTLYVRSAGAAAAAFGQGRRPITIGLSDEAGLNASAAAAENGYHVAIGAGVPALIHLLVSRLLLDARVLPFLTGDTEVRHGPDQVVFVLDPVTQGHTLAETSPRAPERALAASTFGSILTMFIANHEVGHVVCGHVEGAEHYDGAGSYAEFIALAEAPAAEGGRRQAWEYDADAVAATLLLRYLDNLTETKARDLERIFGVDTDIRTHLLATTTVLLFAFFCFWRGSGYALRKHGSHPHPLLRAFYIKDMLFHAAHKDRPLDREAFLALVDERLDECLIALEDLGLSDNARYTDEYLEQVGERLAALRENQVRHRDTCLQWSWIGWTRDQAAPPADM